MNAKDAGVDEGMCAAGMSLEALYKIFKNFDKYEVKAVYIDFHKKRDDYLNLILRVTPLSYII